LNLYSEYILTVSVYLQVKKCVKPELEDQHSDPDFEATLLQLDEQEYVCTREKEKTPVKEKPKPQLNTSESSTNAIKSHTVPNTKRHQETPSKTEKKLLIEKKESKEKETSKPISQPKVSPGLNLKYKKGEYQSVKNEHNCGEKDKSSLPAMKRHETVSGDDAFERKRQHAMQYQRYLQREGPKNPGGKEVPQVLDYVHTVKCSVW
jgi:hypothetical protein